MKSAKIFIPILAVAAAFQSACSTASNQVFDATAANLAFDTPTASRALNVNSSNFRNITNRRLSIVGFYHLSNAESMQMSPTMDRLAQTYIGSVTVGKMQTAGSTGVRIYRNGQILESLPGVIDAEIIIDRVNRYL